MSEILTFCEKCGGAGAIRWSEPAGEPRTVGDVTVQSLGAMGSSLCQCRLTLPPRDGTASWWDTQTIYEQRVEWLPGDGVGVIVKAEIPISEDNYRVVPRGNRYFPTLVDVEVNGYSATLRPDEARDLAAKLLQAADAAAAQDEPDTDVCGHWAPCGCENSRSAPAGDRVSRRDRE